MSLSQNKIFTNHCFIFELLDLACRITIRQLNGVTISPENEFYFSDWSNKFMII